MIISYKKKFIFIHNPKVAGSSIRNIFNKYGISNATKNNNLNILFSINNTSKSIFYRIKRNFSRDFLLGSHSTAYEISLTTYPKYYNNFFKFGFCRNPYTRFYSAYNYLKNGGGNNTDKEWAEKNIYKFKDLESFVLSLNDISFRKKILQWQHFKPQMLFFVDKNNKLIVDYIGKYEKLEVDFNYICGKLKISEELIQLNNTKKDLTNRYSEEMKKIIFETYKIDFIGLDYSF
jgi:hypothetical protein